MTPDQIKEGKSYIGKNGAIYEVLYIQNEKGRTMVRFVKHGPEGGNGKWTMKDFIAQIREEVK